MRGASAAPGFCPPRSLPAAIGSPQLCDRHGSRLAPAVGGGRGGCVVAEAQGGPSDSCSLCPVPSTLSQCIHAAAALLYPFSWAHTYIPVVPESLLDTVCCPTPFMVGVQMRFQQQVMDSPMEEVWCSRKRASLGAGHTWLRTWAPPLTAV